jgi:adenylate cyclase class 2
MRQEIEVKVRVNDLEAFAQKLEAVGCVVSPKVLQEDIIFANYKPFDVFKSGATIARIRKANEKILFTVKKSQSNELDCLEREVEIDNALEMKEAILLMGFYEAVQVQKYRRKTRYLDYEICLDEVEGLGSFVEIEKITENEDAQKVQKELFEILKGFGVRTEDRVERGYDTLVYKKNKGV